MFAPFSIYQYCKIKKKITTVVWKYLQVVSNDKEYCMYGSSIDNSDSDSNIN